MSSCVVRDKKSTDLWNESVVYVGGKLYNVSLVNVSDASILENKCQTLCMLLILKPIVALMLRMNGPHARA
jgi:hypothetical protein